MTEIDWAVQDLLALGQPCVLGGPAGVPLVPIALDLVGSLNTCTPFLDRFPVPRRRKVLFFGEPPGQKAEGKRQKAEGKRQKAEGSPGPRLRCDLADLTGMIQHFRLEVVVALAQHTGNPKLLAAACRAGGATPVLVVHDGGARFRARQWLRLEPLQEFDGRVHRLLLLTSRGGRFRFELLIANC
jgi:hypothetical protein